MLKIDRPKIEIWVLKQVQYLILAVANYMLITFRMIFTPSKVFRDVNNLEENYTISPLVYYMLNIIVILGIVAITNLDIAESIKSIINKYIGINQTEISFYELVIYIFSFINGVVLFVATFQLISLRVIGNYIQTSKVLNYFFICSGIFLPTFLFQGIYGLLINDVLAKDLLEGYYEKSFYHFLVDNTITNIWNTQIVYYLALIWWGFIYYYCIITNHEHLNKKRIVSLVMLCLVGFLGYQYAFSLMRNLVPNYHNLKSYYHFTEIKKHPTSSGEFEHLEQSQRHYSFAENPYLPDSTRYIHYLASIVHQLVVLENGKELYYTGKELIEKREYAKFEQLVVSLVNEGKNSKNSMENKASNTIENILMKTENIKSKSTFSFKDEKIMLVDIYFRPEKEYLRLLP